MTARSLINLFLLLLCCWGYQLEYRQEANRLANNGKERKDLYTANWDGDKYKGSNFNILTVIAAISVMVPLAGLAFAYTTYGVLWG